MAKYVMRKLQRGTTLKLIFSVIRQQSDCSEIATEPIDIDNLALVKMTFKGSNNTSLQLGTKIKKHEGVKNKTVPLTIVCGEIKEHYVCSTEWVEIKNKVILADSSISYHVYNHNNRSFGQQQEATLLYSFEVNITIPVMVSTDPETIPSTVMKHLYEDTEFTDFQLKATDGAVQVHKAVLTAHSDMFKTMLQREEWTETKEGCIKTNDCTVKTLQDLKNYMYLGILPDEDLESLLLIASFYLMDRLEIECITKLIKMVKPSDLEKLVEFACQNNIPNLMKMILFLTPDPTVTSAYELLVVNFLISEK